MVVLMAIMKWWRARQRKVDLAILWPVCVENAPDLDHAKAAFAVHAFSDPAWQDFNDDELKRFIDGLPAVPFGRGPLGFG